MLDLLHALNQQQGRTIVMVLHDLNHACWYADYLIAMKAGQIFAAGDPQSVITVETVQAMFNLQCQIHPDPISGTPMCVPISAGTKTKMN